ncbi:hypothetical protein EV200_10765 [Pedobacter psychrotolerans]|uniref:Uncharacterized protein n=1 Tax=Pedobacter psychrotolerans TaxID=1843235 RepID=A0A4R2H7X8_9SPHI|nr:hypothetical protein [Pedobacter psychrotolerans]TCO21474.1 hypothetical protein EV200_10765 [Pedobacter psychrotolerans]GGE38940.1 hypothetical protein GCM10011413_00610 [Pedobacter psychrotolerans]
MKIAYFIIIGIIAGSTFALIDTIVANAEISSIMPETRELLKNLSVSKVLIYSAIGAIIGIAFYALAKKAFKKKTII